MADPSSRRKLAAILSADVVGYSRLMAANEAATGRPSSPIATLSPAWWCAAAAAWSTRQAMRCWPSSRVR
jgi:hypothetical protein